MLDIFIKLVFINLNDKLFYVLYTNKRKISFNQLICLINCVRVIQNKFNFN